MSIWYKIANGPYGRPLYYVAHDPEHLNAKGTPSRKLTKLADIPELIMAGFENGQVEIDDLDLNLDVPDKNCLFCGEPNCKLTRLLNTEIIYLCDEHYYSKSLGQIAQHIREAENAKQAETAG